MSIRSSEKPDDAIDGPDPTVVPTFDTVQAVRATCPCGYSCVSDDETAVTKAMGEHRRWGHPAYRNPDIACQASPPWDHERWCLRPKGHDGDHWTPSFNGGVGWSNP